LKKVIYQRDFMPEFEAVASGAPVMMSPAMEEATLPGQQFKDNLCDDCHKIVRNE